MNKFAKIVCFLLSTCSMVLSATHTVNAQTDATMQAIAGVWKGSFYVDSTQKTFDYELSISNEKGKTSCYSRLAFEDEKGIKQTVYRDHSVAINGNEIIIKDEKQLTKASSVEQPKELLKTMTLKLTSTDSALQLSGNWVTNKTRRFYVATGTAELSKKRAFTETALFKKLEELGLSTALSYNEPEASLAVSIAKATSISTSKPARKLVGPAPPDVEVNYPTVMAVTDVPIPAATPPEVNIEPARVEAVKPVNSSAIAKLENPPTPKPAPPTVAAIPTPKPKLNNDVVVTTVQKPPQTLPETVPAKVAIATPKAAVPSRPAIQPVVVPTINAAKDVAQRSIASTQTIFYKSDSIGITLYDNGEIDGDTVSVLLNGKVIIARQGLNTKPNVYSIYINPETPDTMTLVMYAENLGSIPPNTGLMVVRDGASIYEVRFSADLKNNAAIILRKRKKE